jgi:hypothetical protein
MNKAILAGMVVIATAASVCAQGTISLSTATLAAPKPHITLDGVNVAAADNIFLQVLIPGSTGLTSTASGTAFEPFKLALTGGNLGLFSKGAFAVGGKVPGSTVDVIIRAWDADTGDTYDSATGAKASQTLSGFALGGVVDPNTGISTLPSPISGFTGLNLVTPVVPEPSTYALAALGLGGLLFLRRK